MTRSCEWLMTCDSSKCHACEGCKKLKGHDSWSTIGQKRTVWLVSYFTTGTRDSSQSRVTQPKPPVLQKNDFSHSFSYSTINTLISMKSRELLERFLRDKPQRTTRLIHPQSYTIDSHIPLLTLSIVIPLRGSLAKSLPHHIHISKKVIWCLESSSKKTNSFG